MKIHRIYAIILRHYYYFKVSFDRATDVFYWPVLDLLLWGITSLYLKKLAPNANGLVLAIISGILFWLVIRRAQNEISGNLLEDLWNKNLINIFVSPLKFSEWIVSLLLIGISKVILSLGFAMLIAFLLFKVQIFFYGFYLLPFIVLLMMTGWWVGFLITGIILRYGTKIQALSWSLITIITPFSAVYYPLSILPHWAQTIAAFLPSSYIFEGAREVIYKGTLDPHKIMMSFLLNCIYLVLSGIFLKRSFDKVLEKGLTNIY